MRNTDSTTQDTIYRSCELSSGALLQIWMKEVLVQTAKRFEFAALPFATARDLGLQCSNFVKCVAYYLRDEATSISWASLKHRASGVCCTKR